MHISVLLVVSDEHVPSITNQIQRSPHTVVIVGSTQSPKKVVQLCASHHPDVVILDPTLDSGELLAEWRGLFGVYPLLICVSASDLYARLAYRAGALHDIDLETDLEEVVPALQRCVSQMVRYDRGDTNGTTARERLASFTPQLVALPSSDGIDMRAPHEFMSAHGEGNYTRIVLQGDPPVLLSKPLGELEAHLERAGMMRIHRSHMINLDHIRRVRRGKSPVVHLSNGEEVDVSETYRSRLFELLHVQISRRQDQA